MPHFIYYFGTTATEIKVFYDRDGKISEISQNLCHSKLAWADPVS